MEKINKKIGLEPYKGVRDFYPEEMAVQNYIFNLWRRTCEQFGYLEYSASVLEPADLYRAKSGEEIVNEQTYTFIDRGEREVTLRPEMTPTVARLVAQKKQDLTFPLRWYSIPNLFRYERPQKGRLREHWQLNVDLFGVAELSAEVEVISLAYEIMKKIGLKDTDFEIRLNNRKVMNWIFNDFLSLTPAVAQKLSKLIDKKRKMPAEDFALAIKDILKEKSQTFLTLLNSKNLEELVANLPVSRGLEDKVAEIRTVMDRLGKLGITNTVFDQTLMRGFDYYTGLVFEIYDRNPANPRSVFGGGRYDDLLGIFGTQKVPAFGFGAGDVIIRDLLETYNLLPTYRPPIALMLCLIESSTLDYANDLAQKLREAGVNVVVNLSNKKIGDQIKMADKQKIPYVICLGEDEIKTGRFKLKCLTSGEEKSVTEEEVARSLS